MRILLVDRSATMRNIQKHLLQSLGNIDVIEAASGAEALESLASAQPDLVLVDSSPPNTEGVALVRRVRETDRQVPIILCAGSALREQVLEAIRAGVNNFVVRPFTTETLAAKIEQTVRRGGAPAAAAARMPAQAS